MTEIWNEKINKHTDWGGDSSTQHLPVSGFRVQEFIKGSLEGKAGYFKLIGDKYCIFSDEESYNEYVLDPTKESLVLGRISNTSHVGEFNANTTTEEGWYDAVVLGRPEGSESDEKYFMYQSSNGGQICFSRRNSGKVYHRLGNGAAPNTDWHPWVPITHDDYSLLQSSSSALNSYYLNQTISVTDLPDITASDFGLAEVYCGYWEVEKPNFHLCIPINNLEKGSIIKVRCFYRWGEGSINNDKYNSDAYIYLSNSQEEGHDISKLMSDFIKVKSLGSTGYPFSGENENLGWVRTKLFTSDSDYGYHTIKCNNPVDGAYYLHVAGDFSVPRSWFVIDAIEVYSPIKSNPYTEQDYNLLHNTADKIENLLEEEGEYYHIKPDGNIQPISHPDISTNPSILPQRFGNKDIYEVIIRRGYEHEIPSNAIVLEASGFDSKGCYYVEVLKNDDSWIIYDKQDITPEYTLIRYYIGKDDGYYGGSGGDEPQSNIYVSTSNLEGRPQWPKSILTNSNCWGCEAQLSIMYYVVGIINVEGGSSYYVISDGNGGLYAHSNPLLEHEITYYLTVDTIENGFITASFIPTGQTAYFELYDTHPEAARTLLIYDTTDKIYGLSTISLGTRNVDPGLSSVVGTVTTVSRSNIEITVEEIGSSLIVSTGSANKIVIYINRGGGSYSDCTMYDAPLLIQFKPKLGVV